MTDYEKARLEKARGYYYLANERDKKMLMDLFPELKEPDDKRIREMLIRIVKNWEVGSCSWTSNQEDIAAILAWLKRPSWKPSEVHMRNILDAAAVLWGTGNIAIASKLEELHKLLSYDAGRNCKESL